MVRWQAQDFNNDKLSYDLYLRGPDQKEWKRVEEDFEQTSLIWDTETMPEGTTWLKLIASDRPDNAPDQALASERVSAPFAIDNSPPEVSLQIQREKEIHVQAEFSDRISPLARAQYTIDYGVQVHQIAPEDGIFDSPREMARFVVADLSPGEHVLSVQAWDHLDNVGVQQVVVEVK